MAKLLPFVQEAVDEANKKFPDELSRLDYINEKFSNSVFIGKAKDLKPKVVDILLDFYSLRKERENEEG